MSGMALDKEAVATAPPASFSDGRIESTISLRIGEVKSLVAQPSGRPRDVYVSVTLDQEEIYRTSTIEKTLNPLFGESFTFQVPRQFHNLSFYVHDAEAITRDNRLIGKVTFTRPELTASHEFTQEQWYPLTAVTPDTEVQGVVHVTVSATDGASGGAQLVVKVVQCAGLGCVSGHFSDVYCMVSLLSMQGESRSDQRRTLVRKRTTDPKFTESFPFKLNSIDDLSDMVVKLSVWHQTLLGEDVFLGHIHLSLAWIEPGKEYSAWYSLTPRCEIGGGATMGSMRLTVVYHEDCIHSAAVYEPLRTLLVESISEEDFKNAAVYILHDVCRDRASYSRAIVKIFLQLNKFEALAERLINEEVDATTDPNTIFRGNSVASKVIDEFMKVVGSTYLQRTLQTCIDEIFELRRSCEIDPTRLAEGEDLNVNMTNLLFFVEKVLSAITSSSRSCPAFMIRIFHLLSTSAVRKFAENADIIKYTSVSGFVFLRFFAPAILNPKLFGLRPENPTPLVARCLLLISKTIQNLGNIGAKRVSTIRKEDYMVPLLTELMDDSHVTIVKNYLDEVSCSSNDDLSQSVQVSVYREGFLIKRAFRKKFGPRNFKQRYFMLTNNGLSYSKSRSESIIHTIPISDMLAVERVDEAAFSMKFMMQLVQPEQRVLYIQAMNSVDQMKWLSSLSRACCMNKRSNIETVHSGAYLNNCWTCCGHPSQDQFGCKPVTLAVKLLGRHEEADIERELHRVYRLLLENQETLLELKASTTRSARASEIDYCAVALPRRLRNICELLIFVKNLELSSKTIKRHSVQFGTRDIPYTCAVGEACVVR